MSERRDLRLKKEVLTELSPDELNNVGAGAATLDGMCAESFPTACGIPPIPTCNYMCTNTSTVFKG